MKRVPTSIKIVDGSIKWGMLTVIDSMGAIVRQKKISAVDHQAVVAGFSSFPPGCTQEEWLEGRAFLAGRPCEPGDATNSNGTLTLNYGITITETRVDVKIMRIPPNLWELRGEIVWVDALVAEQVGLGAA